jgi:DNA-binding CsgD family transcriptional regulator
MNEWVVWFNVVAFALMFCAFAFSFVGYIADRRPWMRTYLIYLASYALWLILLTWSFFRAAFLSGAYPGVDLGVGWVRVAVSLVIGFAAPLMVVQLDKGRATRRSLILLAIVPVLILLCTAAYLFLRQTAFAIALNIAFNGFEAAVAAWGMRVLRRRTPDPRAPSLRMFFLLSVILYDIFILYAAANLIVALPILPETSTLLAGLFGLSWGILVIVDQLRASRVGKAEKDALPPYFIKEFRVTDREGAIIRLLSRGSTTREIGQQLFVSPRTVETHARNIYRKCGVTNKVALLNLIDSCRGR